MHEQTVSEMVAVVGVLNEIDRANQMQNKTMRAGPADQEKIVDEPISSHV
jgi:hypothetical protein